MSSSVLEREFDSRPILSARRVGAAIAVGALGVMSTAMLTQTAAHADPSPLGSVAAENADGADVYSSPLVGEPPAEPVFGNTKVTAQILPVAGTSGASPDLSGGEFTLTATGGGASLTCTTDATGLCYFPTTPNGNAIPGNTTYTVVQTVAPTGFFINTTPVTVGRCINLSVSPIAQCGPIQPGGILGQGAGTDDNKFTFADQGDYRTVDVVAKSSFAGIPDLIGVTDAPDFVTGLLSDTTFELRATADGPALGTATTDGNGQLEFDGTFAPGDYFLVETAAKAGYVALAAPLALNLPEPTTADEASTPVTTVVTNAPDIAAPLLVADTATLTLGAPETSLDVLANDNLFGADAYILAAESTHGTVRVGAAPGCALPAIECDQVIYYTADSTYLGADVIQYEVATRGGIAHSTETVTVNAVPIVAVAAVISAPIVVPVLANTGLQHISAELVYGGALVLVGAGLAMAGSRRRSRV